MVWLGASCPGNGAEMQKLRTTTSKLPSSLQVEAMQMLIAPGKHDLQNGVELCEGGRTTDQEVTPDERTNAAQDDTQLVNVQRCGRGCHELRIAPRRVPLKGFPRYVTLSLYSGH